MPRQQPVLGWEHIRNYAEKWSWTMDGGRTRKVGYNVPDGATDARHVPFHLRCLTLKGEVMTGEVICLKVFLNRHQRLVKFTASNEIRCICDALIMEIDGVKFVTH